MPNPALNRFRNASVTTPTAGEIQQMYNQPAYLRQTGPARYMTLDDVVVRLGAMLATILATGTVAWSLTNTRTASPLLFLGVFGGLALALYITFTMRANAVTSLLYAGLEGLALGSISRLYEAAYHGVVVQAVIGTVMVAVGVLVAYRVGAIRVTPKFWRITVAATFGILGLFVVNAIAYAFTPHGLGLNGNGGFAILITLVCILVAAMNLVIDFDFVEQSIRRGSDVKLAWYGSFAITVTLVWLYLEILRLLGASRR